VAIEWPSVPPTPAEVARIIQQQARNDAFRITPHGQQEMVEEAITLDPLLQALRSCQILEDYPEHLRGACCLVLGYTEAGRPLHVVCTTSLPTLVIITVYEPQPPRWVTPTQRGR
jgi:hypothetical protein